MTSRNFIWYALPMMVFLSFMWLYEPWFYQRFIASEKIEKIKKRNFKIVGHKGAAGYAPENTLASIQIAMDLGADMIEIDVHYTKDGEVVVFHDETLERTTNGTGNVHEKTLAELKELDAGSWKSPAFEGEKIPTLGEVIDLIHGKMGCIIDIKTKGHGYYDGFAERIVEIIDDRDAMSWCIIQSYDEQYLEHAYEKDSTIEIKKIMMGEDEAHLLSFYINAKSFTDHRNKHEFFSTLNPHFKSLSQRRIFRFHARGYKVYTYVVNERSDILKMLNMGVDGIITDYPDRVVEIREELEALDKELGIERVEKVEKKVPRGH
jgi:glycerophosphoryl diester phosphodiesterase